MCTWVHAYKQSYPIYQSRLLPWGWMLGTPRARCQLRLRLRIECLPPLPSRPLHASHVYFTRRWDALLISWTFFISTPRSTVGKHSLLLSSSSTLISALRGWLRHNEWHRLQHICKFKRQNIRERRIRKRVLRTWSSRSHRPFGASAYRGISIQETLGSSLRWQEARRIRRSLMNGPSHSHVWRGRSDKDTLPDLPMLLNTAKGDASSVECYNAILEMELDLHLADRMNIQLKFTWRSTWAQIPNRCGLNGVIANLV